MQNKKCLDKKRRKVRRTFDPFNDRLSRDIRNSLSDVFVASLKQKDASHYKKLFQKWLAKETAPVYKDYIQNRIQHCDLAFNLIQKQQLDDARVQALILWNNGLFFEVHDILEDIWHQTKGDDHQALKGLIKAAGVYVHLENGRTDSAKRLAEKSLRLVRKYPSCLGFILNLDDLIDALRACKPVPPKLKYAAIDLERNNNDESSHR